MKVDLEMMKSREYVAIHVIQVMHFLQKKDFFSCPGIRIYTKYKTTETESC